MARFVYRLEQAFMGIAVLCMITVMFIVAYDAFARYAFSAPLPWAFEVLRYYLLVSLAYFAVSSTFQRGDHIGVDLFYNLMGKRAQLVCSLISAAFAAALFIGITYATGQNMLKLYARGAAILGYFAYPAWLSYLPVVLGSGLMVVRLVVHFVTLLIRGEDPDVVIHEGEAT